MHSFTISPNLFRVAIASTWVTRAHGAFLALAVICAGVGRAVGDPAAPAPSGILDVQPATGILAFGPSGGPFNGSGRTYTVSNLGNAPLEWRAQVASCPLTPGLVAWWPFDGDGSDVTGRNTGQVSPTTLYVPGLVGKALRFGISSDLVAVAPSPTLDVGVGVGLTLEAWIRPDSTGNQEPIFEWGNGTVPGTGLHLWHSVKGPGTLYANLIDTQHSAHEIWSSSGSISPNAWNHVALTFNRVTGLASLYINGASVLKTYLGSITPQTSATLYFGQRNVAGFSIIEYHGLIDEPAVYDHALTPEEIAAIYQAGALGKCPTRSWVTVSSSGGTLLPGGFATVDVQLSSKAALLSPGGYVDGLSFVNLTSGQGGAVLPLSLQVINRQPTLDPISPVEVPLHTTQQLIGLSGITAGGSEKQGLQLTAVSDNPLLVPNPIEVAYASPSSDAVLRLKFAPDVVGSAKITVTVKDDGGTSLGGVDTITREFAVTVTSGDGGGGNTGGVLVVEPVEGFVASGFTGGPFQPLSKTYTVRNTGTGALSWQATPSSCPIMAGLVAWWPLDGDGTDIIGGNDLSLAPAVAFAPGEVNQALGFPAGIPTAFVPAKPSLNVGISSGFTLEAWINPTSVGSQQPIFEYSNGTAPGTGVHFWHSVGAPGTLFLNIIDTSGGFHEVTSPQGVIVQKTWSHVAATYDRTTGVVSLYANGALVKSQVIGSVIPQTSYALYLGQRVNLGFPTLSFVGSMDEPSVYSRALSASELLSIYVSGAAGKCGGASWASAVPSFGYLPAGASSTFNIRANGKASTLDAGTYLATFSVSNVGTKDAPVLLPSIIQIINRPPTLDPIASFEMLEGSGSQVVYLSGISAGGKEKQRLTVTATSDNPGLITNPIEVVYTSPSPTGIMRLNLAPGASGLARISVVVADDGGTAYGAVNSVTNQFYVTVNTRVESISIHDIPDQILAAGDVMVVVPELTLLNVLPQSVGYQLGVGAPGGVLLNPTTGAISWNTAGVVPGLYSLSLTAFDKTATYVADTKSFHVTVRGFPYLTAEVADGQLVLRWTSAPGHAYKLQLTRSMANPAWTELPTEYVAAGETTEARVALKTRDVAFYRVVLVR